MGSGVDATDAIDATDTAMVGETAAASTTDKPKWYILDLTETRVLPITLEISAIPTPSATSFRSCRSCSIDHNLPLKHKPTRHQSRNNALKHYYNGFVKFASVWSAG